MRKFVIVGALVIITLSAYACIAVGAYEDPHLWEGE